jgi:acyl-CoA hydrolase
MAKEKTAGAPVATAERDFARVAPEDVIERTAQALEANGIRAIIVETAAEAKQALLDLIPEGAQVHSASSRTLEEIDVIAEIQESGRYDAVKPKIYKMDRATQMDEIRKLTASPDYMLGSVHAVTEQGEVIIASGSGSQVGPYVYGASKVIWVIGAQKIVSDVDEGLRRTRDYVRPKEAARMGIAIERFPLRVPKVLIYNFERPGRITAIIVKEPLGF